MEGETASISLSGLRRAPERIDEDVVVGKDVIELLAGAMYADPLTVFREYVQNAADAIDQARDQDLHFDAGAPHVRISFDHGERTIRIRDAGIGLSGADFVRRLSSIGASKKRGANLRGFRGVGRLSGLGYCQELVFRSRSTNSSKIWEMRWDGRALRDKLRDPKYGGSLADLVRDVVTVTAFPDATGYPDRFFEVEMRKVMRIKNDLLMNEHEVRRYLSEVAPLPFSPNFTFAARIRSWLSERGVGEPVIVELADGHGPIYHRAINEVISKAGVVTFNNVECLEITNTAGDLLAVGWLLDHGYIGALPRASCMAGIRLRVRDVQVGGEQILGGLFPESRFATWAAGEFHVVHPRIVPNGRRDDFEHSATYTELQDSLHELGKKIGQLIRAKSDDRMRRRRARLALMYAQQWLEVARNVKHHRTIREVAAHEVESQLKVVDKESSRISLSEVVIKEVADVRSSVKRLLTNFAKGKPKGRPPIGRTKGAYAAVSAILSSTTQIRKALPMAERVLMAMEGTVRKVAN